MMHWVGESSQFLGFKFAFLTKNSRPTSNGELGRFAVLRADHVDGPADVVAVVRLLHVVDHQVPGIRHLLAKITAINYVSLFVIG